MTRFEAALRYWQDLSGAVDREEKQAYRDPSTLKTQYVCPHCKRELATTSVHCDGHVFIVSGACREHGAVVPMRSAVTNATI